MAEEKKLPVPVGRRGRRGLKDELPGWWHEGRWIRRKYNTDGGSRPWPRQHHRVSSRRRPGTTRPRGDVGQVWVKLRTHSANGVTDRDLALAKRIEAAALWRPEPGSPMEGRPTSGCGSGSPTRRPDPPSAGRGVRRPRRSRRGMARILFVTGKLAEPALRATLAGMTPGFEYDVAVLRIRSPPS